MRQTETTRLHDDVERTEFSDHAKSARTERRTHGATKRAGLRRTIRFDFGRGQRVRGFSVIRHEGSDHPFAAIQTTKRLGEALHVNS